MNFFNLVIVFKKKGMRNSRFRIGNVWWKEARAKMSVLVGVPQRNRTSKTYRERQEGIY